MISRNQIVNLLSYYFALFGVSSMYIIVARLSFATGHPIIGSMLAFFAITLIGIALANIYRNIFLRDFS